MVNSNESAVRRRSPADWFVALALFILFFLLTLVTTGENALAVTLTVGVLAAVVQTKWSSRRDARLWVLVVAIATIQIPAAFVVHISRIPAPTALVCFPFVVIEGFALWGLINWIERRFPRSGGGRTSTGS